MPTTRPRHTVTETERVSVALDAAEQRWPGERRSELLRRLIEAGHEALAASEQDQRRRREQAVEATAGALEGAYPDGYLERLRQQWPE